MLQRTNKILIGKDIDRTAAVVGGADFTTLIAPTTGLASGEIVVLDKNKEVLGAGATVADSNLIYIVQGSARTFNYTNEDGTTSVTAARELISSDPIEGKLVKSFQARTHVPKAEKTASFNLAGYTMVAGTEYIVRIIYKDIKEHPGQFTHTYRHIGTTAILDTEGALIVAKINKHKGRRVSATYTAGTDTILLTALPIPDCTTATTDIDAFDMVDFDAKFLYVNSSGNWAIIPATSTTVTYTGPTKGSGNWEQIRDIEKAQLGYIGNTNLTHFPIITKTLDTQTTLDYNMLVIEHDKSYLSPDNQYVKQAPLTTIVALPVAALQIAHVLGQLNPWMASAGFTAVAF